MPRVLLLGGTAEARALAAVLHPQTDIVSSLAGRVPDPALPVGPVRVGGFGGTAVDVMLVMEALGEGLVVEPYWVNVGLGGRLIARGGSVAQQKRILPELIQGKHRLAFAHTERAARYDLRELLVAVTRTPAFRYRRAPVTP